MSYILIIFWLMGGKPAIAAVQMGSHTACMAAAEEMKKRPTGFGERIDAVCIPNWSKQ